ncbi:MAG: hypothetical protein WBB48_10315 [Thermodesulfobacteriota bacterium]
MKSLILSIGLVLVVAMSISCDENNNVIAQEPPPGQPMLSGMTTINGTVTLTNSQCSSALEGFSVGDSVNVQLSAGDGSISGQITNSTNNSFAECSTTSGITTDTLPITAMVCTVANSTFAGLVNGDTMSLLVSLTWVDNFVDGIDKTVAIVAGDIGIMTNTKNLPCARVKIDNITASN